MGDLRCGPMRGSRAGAVAVALLVAGCTSTEPTRAAPRPSHAITVILSLTGVQPWTPEAAGCHGLGSLEDLKVGTPITVSSYGTRKKLAEGAISNSKTWLDEFGRPDTCTLWGTIPAVPPDASYKFTFGERVEGWTVDYASVAKNWTVQAQL
jgi:hypothetical protein